MYCGKPTAVLCDHVIAWSPTKGPSSVGLVLSGEMDSEAHTCDAWVCETCSYRGDAHIAWSDRPHEWLRQDYCIGHRTVVTPVLRAPEDVEAHREAVHTEMRRVHSGITAHRLRSGFKLIR